nr:asparagine synthetase B [Cyclobacteriaceae bacterium]
FRPWDDAVTLVMEYAEVKYDKLWDEEVMQGKLSEYDWLHLHHEDFTGQPGKIRWRESAAMELRMNEATAAKLGYPTISQMKMNIARKIKAFAAGGGYLFAMCSAAETLDIALAAEGFDFNSLIIDSDTETYSQDILDYDKALAFENFILEPSYERRFSDINIGRSGWGVSGDYFNLFTFSAKWDIVPTLLTQNHANLIKEFSGLTTSFNRQLVKPGAVILAENRKENNVRYLYGELGKGHFTYYSGHDPESNASRGRGPTDLNLHPNSAGYRLILNNVLFPSAQKKKQKT